MKKLYTDVKEFTIQRSKWLRGRGSINSSLLNEKGEMCCLGFYGIACELRPQDIRGKTEPVLINKDWDTFLVDVDVDMGDRIGSDEGSEMMMTNDDSGLSNKEREEKLTDLFKEQGITINFVD